jgi:hypothetical protein
VKGALRREKAAEVVGNVSRRLVHSSDPSLPPIPSFLTF